MAADDSTREYPLFEVLPTVISPDEIEVPLPHDVDREAITPH
ncbi:MAG: hypothetical protein QF570_14385 [Myxococcota bacterium]|nr:hypothetical protein [Myxococcota bacterium]